MYNITILNRLIQTVLQSSPLVYVSYLIRSRLTHLNLSTAIFSVEPWLLALATSQAPPPLPKPILVCIYLFQVFS
ncbi:hypothetical protein F2Q70_00039347 [Brassica cretica]|uniref:Uncharacterized protein n=1 Tax=Brassica cretica TaxID=69181 RepID=A0A8S9MJX2_BRACR|nr:hypothetical protein F2Q70_00039347 [Brassica cretica]KAF2620684.1 hypothetical protein F2Q68_00040040 [Brassica cretica]